jgi:Ca-activated chloride channel homolog
MEWQHPQWLYGILPLAVAWLALALFSRSRRRRAAEAFVAQAMWSRILPQDSRARFWVKLLLRETALVAGLVALAGPQWGTRYEEIIPRGSDLYVLIDVSRSMLAEDVPPSRLGRAKSDVAALVNRLEGERVGLIAFAGQAVVKCPLTVDYDAFRRSLDELDPSSAPRGGTAIGDAIRKALEVFQARADRDQAILLITDGDDQQSYPLEAAAVAAERHVTIFTVGLGDANQGSRIPRNAQAKSYVEYQGQQVWTKMDGSLLKDIALKTSGVYVPVETRAYDLGELYTKYLHGRRGTDEQSRKRIRRADQFQIFLALAVLALLADAFTSSYPRSSKSQGQGLESDARVRRGTRLTPCEPVVSVSTAFLFLATVVGASAADNPSDAVRDGLSFYGKGEFEKAKNKFEAAREQFSARDTAKAAIAAFDQACALHRKGDVAQAREWYLKAGLAHDKKLAASAHFNLGTLAAEEARRLAGGSPDDVGVDKRQEILDQLKTAVASFRHSLELQPDNSHARRDIELVRQWIKYYSDKWQARDREIRRKETNLVAFLEYLVESQRTLRESVKALPATAPADAYAEPKRLQDELLEEIGPLKDKIKNELTPQPSGSGTGPQGNSREVEKGITLLQGWANDAGKKMSSASRQLDERRAGPAVADEQSAIDELEKIWDAVIPFQALLARDVTDQTQIAQSLAPASSEESNAGADEPSQENNAKRDKTKPGLKASSHGAVSSSLGSEAEDLAPVIEIQERTLRRTQLLKLKAEAELARFKDSHPSDKEQEGVDSKTPPNAGAAKSTPVDPKQIEAGYEKAIELAPRAGEQMDRAIKMLKQKNSQAAYPPADEARKILEDIQKSQPKNDQQDQKPEDQNKKNDDQQKQDQKDQEKKDQEKKDQQKKDQQKKDQQKKEEGDKKDQQKKNQGQNKKEEPSKSEQNKQDQKQSQVSRDRIEEALRKVRERQEEKRERDRKINARVIGRVPVEKDW